MNLNLEGSQLPCLVRMCQHSIQQPLGINYRGATGEFQNKGLGVSSHRENQVPFSACEEH